MMMLWAQTQARTMSPDHQKERSQNASRVFCEKARSSRAASSPEENPGPVKISSEVDSQNPAHHSISPICAGGVELLSVCEMFVRFLGTASSKL
mmetsp:Transcript_42599/g.62691  ORF Transcript_42599/g.62691 Transcript_42599/m.62691 type:complete len:94 (-) Transcript_42599:374-655(-)